MTPSNLNDHHIDRYCQHWTIVSITLLNVSTTGAKSLTIRTSGTQIQTRAPFPDLSLTLAKTCFTIQIKKANTIWEMVIYEGTRDLAESATYCACFSASCYGMHPDSQSKQNESNALFNSIFSPCTSHSHQLFAIFAATKFSSFHTSQWNSTRTSHQHRLSSQLVEATYGSPWETDEAEHKVQLNEDQCAHSNTCGSSARRERSMQR